MPLAVLVAETLSKKHTLNAIDRFAQDQSKGRHYNACELVIALPGTAISLNFDAELVHVEDLQYGFKFISEDLETLTHLRKLIELNTGDAETTRSELSAWLKD